MATNTALWFLLAMACLNTPLVRAETGFWSDNENQQSNITNVGEPHQKGELRSEILNLLGLHQRPVLKALGDDFSAPAFMLALYKSITEDENQMTEGVEFHSSKNVTLGEAIEHINGTDVIRSFVNNVRHALSVLSAKKIPHLRHDKDATFYFDTSEVGRHESVAGAEFRIYKSKAKKKWNCRIELFRIAQGVDPEDKTLEPECNATLEWDYEGWVYMNVTRAVWTWLNSPFTNLGLYIRVKNLQKGRHIEPGKIGLVGRRGPDDKQAFMVGFFRSEREVNVRSQRSVDYPSKTSANADNFYPVRETRKKRRRRHRLRLGVAFGDTMSSSRDKNINIM